MGSAGGSLREGALIEHAYAAARGLGHAAKGCSRSFNTTYSVTINPVRNRLGRKDSMTHIWLLRSSQDGIIGLSLPKPTSTNKSAPSGMNTAIKLWRAFFIRVGRRVGNYPLLRLRANRTKKSLGDCQTKVNDYLDPLGIGTKRSIMKRPYGAAHRLCKTTGPTGSC
jgi:hypothetical protein